MLQEVNQSQLENFTALTKTMERNVVQTDWIVEEVVLQMRQSHDEYRQRMEELGEEGRES